MKTSRRLAAGAAVGLFGVLILFRGLYGRDPATAIWGGSGEQNLIYWILEWGHHVLGERWDWLDFWHANAFYPHAHSLAFSESLLSAQVLYTPLRLAGLGPLPAMHLTLALTCLFAAALSYRALCRIGGFTSLEIAAVVYVSHFGLSMTAFLGPHLQLFGFQSAPPFFLYLYLYLRDWRAGDLLAACLAYAAGACFSAYTAPMIAVAGAIVAAPLLVRACVSQGIGRVARGVAVALPVAAVFAAVLYLVQFRHYARIGAQMPMDYSAEAPFYSAKLSSLFSLPSPTSLWYARDRYAWGQWEYAYFPGWAVMRLSGLYAAAACVTAIVARRTGRCGAREASGRVPRMLSWYAAGLFAVCWLLSLGPLIVVAGRAVPGPFAAILRAAPPLAALRAPGRFGMLIGLPLALLAVCALRVYCRGWVRHALGILVFAAFVIESLPAVGVGRFSIPHRGVYERLGPHVAAGEPLLVLPAARRDLMQTVRLRMAHLTASTLHWGRIVTGHGSRETRELARLSELDRDFQAGDAGFDELARLGGSLGISKVLVFPRDYAVEQRRQIEQYLAGLPPGRIVLPGGEGVLFTLPGAGDL